MKGYQQNFVGEFLNEVFKEANGEFPEPLDLGSPEERNKDSPKKRTQTAR